MSLSNSAFHYRSACISKVRLCLHVLSLLASPPLLQMINFCSHFIFPEKSPPCIPRTVLSNIYLVFTKICCNAIYVSIYTNKSQSTWSQGQYHTSISCTHWKARHTNIFLLTKLNNTYGTERQIAWCSGHGFWTRLP